MFLFKSGANYSRGSLAIFSVVGLVLLIGARYVISLKLNAALLDGSLSAPRTITIGDTEFLSPTRKFKFCRGGVCVRWAVRCCQILGICSVICRL